MIKLYANYHRSNWTVSSDRVHNYYKGVVTGVGKSLPAAYLDYMRKLERALALNKADKAEEQRCIDEIIKKQNKGLDNTPQIDVLPDRFDRPGKIVIAEPVKHWWQFWK